MTDQFEIDEDLKAAELEALKDQATKLGIKFHPAIGEDKLREKVSQAMAEQETAAYEEVDQGAKATPNPKAAKPETETEARIRLKKQATELIRIRLTCMNPNKREWEADTFTAGNSVIGSVTKVVPFNVPWHVPRIIYNQIVEKKFQAFFTVKDAKGRSNRKSKLIAEYAIEVLPEMTEQELKELAQRQAMANGAGGL